MLITASCCFAAIRSGKIASKLYEDYEAAQKECIPACERLRNKLYEMYVRCRKDGIYNYLYPDVLIPDIVNKADTYLKKGLADNIEDAIDLYYTETSDDYLQKRKKYKSVNDPSNTVDDIKDRMMSYIPSDWMETRGYRDYMDLKQ